MPELPEVEVTRLSFAAKIADAKIISAALGKPLRWPLGCEVQTLAGRHVKAVRRRGKYLLLDLDPGLLLVHLGMSGSLSFSSDMAPSGIHDHFDLVTSKGVLRLHDPRRFGAVVFAPDEASAAAQKLIGKMGVEPLSDEFCAASFHAALKQRKSAIKQVLLAGEAVVGVGNIYASEALFLARIRPTFRASRISLVRASRLHAAIRNVLARAVETGGSTLRDFKSADGKNGYFQMEAMVYARQDLPCKICTTPIRLLRQGQRSTFFCPSCQKN